MVINAFEINFSDVEIQNVKTKVASFPWHEMPKDGGWSFGANIDYMKNLADYWTKEYDWKSQEVRLNQFPNYKTKVDDLDIHFIIKKSSSPKAIPLILIHGWPGSIVEFLEIIDPLCEPEKYGNNNEVCFDIIAPSIPGFAFSGKPENPIGPRRIASIFNKLMTENLGYEKYVAQGGDWGSAISTWLGFDHSKNCKGIHINMLPARHIDGPKTEEEKSWDRQFSKDYVSQSGYFAIQSTKPQTLSYAMMDSPVGVAAWIIEKFYHWSDLEDRSLELTYQKDDLLTNIMIYILTKSFNTSSWIYYGRAKEGGRILSQDGRRVEVPTGCAVYPKEFLTWPPKSYVERLFNLVHWTEMKNGGHFAALEQPSSLIKDIQGFCKKVVI
ncbi:epoxide hydrolase [Paracoccaceae bacterium]|nr:epoxide hydrolase [Paracoccaceae bacterium]